MTKTCLVLEHINVKMVLFVVEPKIRGLRILQNEIMFCKNLFHLFDEQDLIINCFPGYTIKFWNNSKSNCRK